jgi:NAD(P)-dependent dehydrogenase (short-subunit alcohol dehydrogenase family)
VDDVTHDKSVVVTGAGSGIGRSIALTLAKAGWFVVGVEIDAQSAGVLSADLGANGAVLAEDVTASGAMESAAELAVRSASLAGWVNNAGLCPRGTTLADADLDLVRRVWSVNADATFQGCKSAVNHFRTGGSIVNISSIHSGSSYLSHPEYDMSKAGIEGLTRSIAVAYGREGIRCNAVAPGAIETEMYREGVERAGGSLAEANTPLGRVGRTDEIAAVVAFLLGDEASFITGQTIRVDGGWSVALAAQ